MQVISEVKVSDFENTWEMSNILHSFFLFEFFLSIRLCRNFSYFEYLLKATATMTRVLPWLSTENKSVFLKTLCFRSSLNKIQHLI